MEANKNPYFYCYSIKLKDFLKMNGLQYIRRGKHTNGNYYWMFAKSQLLNDKLLLWNEYKKFLDNLGQK